MFLKPLKIRSQNQLKTSDKKRLIEDILKSFSSLTSENLETVIPKKEDVLLLKIETATKLLIPVYVVKDKPIIFVYNHNLIPTLHMLWKYPNIILAFKTHNEVIKKLINGADFMLPGVIEPSVSNLPEFSKDSPACVIINKKLIPVIGVTATNSREMLLSTKGKCVFTLHVIGDKLYNLKNLCSNIPSPLEELLILIKNLHVKEESKTILMSDTLKNIKSDPIDTSSDNEDKESLVNSTEEMDNLLMYTLCVAIKYGKGLQFPILTSSFFKTHMVLACPPNKTLDVKKSSFKKFGVFMKHMMELDILKVEEQKKGVEYITEFNYEHSFINEFYLKPSDRPKCNKEIENSVKPIISEAHSVTAAVSPFFEEFNLRKGSVIDNSEVRKLITEYVRLNGLQDQNNKSIVILNDVLRFAVKIPYCTFEELMRNIYNLMSPCYKIVCGESVIIHKGKLEPINITVAKRSGNKKVTLVDNIEIYGINITELGNICQRGVAASTTIIRSDTRKSSQLLIQGNQVIFVYNLLTEKCLIPKRYVKGLEFAPKKQ